MEPDQLDKQNLEEFDKLYPGLKERAIRVYQDMFRVYGVRMRCTSGYRSLVEQSALYAQGRTQPGPIVSWAKPGKSMHNYALAFDSCFAGNDPYLEYMHKGNPDKAKELWEGFGSLCEAHGLQWGGRWLDERQDRPHAQRTYGLNLPQIMALYAEGGMRALTKRLDELAKAEA